MSNPQITVLIPFLVGSFFPDEAIHNLLNQSSQISELIVLGDQVINSKSRRRFPRVKFITNKKINSIKNVFNEGLKISSGKYIAIIFPNETSNPDRFRIQSEFLCKNRRAGGLGCTIDLEYDNVIKEIKLNEIPGSPILVNHYLLTGNYLNFSSFLFRKSFLIKYGLQLESGPGLSGEYDFMAKCAANFLIYTMQESLVRRKCGVLLSKRISAAEEKKNNEIRLSQLKKLGIMLKKEDEKIYFKLTNGRIFIFEELKRAEILINQILLKKKTKKLFSDTALLKLFEDLLGKAVSKSMLGGWSIEKRVVDFITQIVPAGSLLLEFGSGDGTDAFLERYNVISIEHDPAFTFSHSKNNKVIYAPIVKGWYEREKIRQVLRLDFCFILIDGPPEQWRSGILKNIDLFAKIRVPIVFDDMNRESDRETMITFCKYLNYNYQILPSGQKYFAYCTYRS